METQRTHLQEEITRVQIVEDYAGPDAGLAVPVRTEECLQKIRSKEAKKQGLETARRSGDDAALWRRRGALETTRHSRCGALETTWRFGNDAALWRRHNTCRGTRR